MECVLCGVVAGCYGIGVCTVLWGGSNLLLCFFNFVLVWQRVINMACLMRGGLESCNC